jgi:hypothetical protein
MVRIHAVKLKWIDSFIYSFGPLVVMTGSLRLGVEETRLEKTLTAGTWQSVVWSSDTKPSQMVWIGVASRY